jgi:hypothetical protein
MKLANYGPKPATVRRQLTRDLASALAHQRAGHPKTAEEWSRKLIGDMVRAKLLRDEGDRYAAYLRNWERTP